MINREKVHDLVSVFYQPVFKTFYVDSHDGDSIDAPFGVFVSLGITTSMETLKNICNTIAISKDFDAVLGEISSKRVDNQYLNTLVKTKDLKQYKLEEPVSGLMNEKEAKEELTRLKDSMTTDTDLDTLERLAPKISKLQYLISRLDESNGWDAHNIQKEDSGYRIYHLYVNYEKRGDLEYRIGIFVTDKNHEEGNNTSSSDSV